MRAILAASVSCIILTGCAGMTETQQRALTGTAGGAGVGAYWAPLAAMRVSAPLSAPVLASRVG